MNQEDNLLEVLSILDTLERSNQHQKSLFLEVQKPVRLLFMRKV